MSRYTRKLTSYWVYEQPRRMHERYGNSVVAYSGREAMRLVRRAHPTLALLAATRLELKSVPLGLTKTAEAERAHLLQRIDAVLNHGVR